MRTVKELSKLTGISVRALHYYDEIGLLRPTRKSEAGYRLYDDKALEALRQILFFREFDIPLREIKALMESPVLDRDQILHMQREMLTAKKERLQRLIDSIDQILKGENAMDFQVFHENDMERLYQSIMGNLTQEQKKTYMDTFLSASEDLTEEEKKRFWETGDSEERFRTLFLKSASGQQAQKNFKKLVEWYGDKDSVIDSAKGSVGDPGIFEAYRKRLDGVMKKLANRRGAEVSSFEVKELIGEYDFLSKQLYQMKDVKALMLDLAGLYRTNQAAAEGLDGEYGPGTAEFFAKAVEEFYK